MVRLSDCMAIEHYPRILLVPYSTLYGNWQLRYTNSFFIDFSFKIYNDLIPIQQKSLMIYISDHMVIEHCLSNHLIPIIVL